MSTAVMEPSTTAPPADRDLPDVKGLAERLLAAGTSDLYRALIAAVDRVALDAVLRHVGGNQVRASEILGISRTTLRGKLRAAGLTADGRRKSGGVTERE